MSREAALDKFVYNWSVRTRILEDTVLVCQELSVIHGMDGSWSGFATWLYKNPVAKVLWFPILGKSGGEVRLCIYSLSTKYPRDSINASLK